MERNYQATVGNRCGLTFLSFRPIFRPPFAQANGEYPKNPGNVAEAADHSCRHFRIFRGGTLAKINTGRVILGGIVAGIVADLLGYLVDGVMLAPRWAEGMKALGHSEFSSNAWIWFNLLGLAGGIVLIWLYASIRPRFGAGPRTALYAGLAVWIVGVLLPNASLMWAAGLFPANLTLMTTLGALVEVIVGALAGAALYKEA